MTVYNILFPFLILLALGVAVHILVRRLPEAVEQKIVPVKVEKKRWWQLFWAKGEGFLRFLRVLILKTDNRLSSLIKTAKERKEQMGESLKEYREKHRKKKSALPENASDPEPIKTSSIPELEEDEISHSTWRATKGEEANFEREKREKDATIPRTLYNKNLAKISKYPPDTKIARVPSLGKKNRNVEEILKKTFTRTEIKVETEQYWKRKEEMLIKSIVLDPKNVNLFIQLGRLYSSQHNWKDARNAFYEVLKLDKTNIKAKEELKRINKYLEKS